MENVVNPICVCGHPMAKHCGDGCFHEVDRTGPFTPVFCGCTVSGGQYDPTKEEPPPVCKPKPLNCRCEIDPETQTLSTECGYHLFWLQGKIDRKVEEMFAYVEEVNRKVLEDLKRDFRVGMVRAGWPESSRPSLRGSDENVR